MGRYTLLPVIWMLNWLHHCFSGVLMKVIDTGCTGIATPWRACRPCFSTDPDQEEMLSC